MPIKETLQIHPAGWENDPDEERFKLSVIDPTPNAAYCHYVLFFRLRDDDKKNAITILTKGLEITLRQVEVSVAP